MMKTKCLGMRSPSVTYGQSRSVAYGQSHSGLPHPANPVYRFIALRASQKLKVRIQK
ncbi:MAG: hypothetical protein F6K55_16565 [Moorea sp. SIO4A3]|nr:hypothetical protein [Moorena sp. SIO4A3]